MRRNKAAFLWMCMAVVAAIIFISNAVAEERREITCAGKVVDNDGRPIAKAKVVLYYNHSKWGLGNRILEETRSVTDGSFIFKKPLIYSDTGKYPYGRDSFVILATHPNYALCWHKIDRNQKKVTYELILTEPVSQTVTVTDLAGNPLAGARVWPYSIGNPTDTVPEFQDYLSLPTDERIIGSITSEDGRAVINNLPRTRRSFYAILKGYARGLSFTGEKPIRLTKAGILRGSVINENSEPVEGALIRLRASWMWQFFLTRTDSQGKFCFDDLPAQGWDMSAWGRGGVGSGIYSITMEHDDYTTWQTKVQLEPGQKLENFMIDAYPGTLINCRVIETETNRPVAGVRINGQNESGRIDGYSDSNGLFRIRVTPGQTRLMFYLPPEGVYLDGGLSLQRDDLPESNLNFYADGDEMDVTLKTPRIAGHLTSVHGIVLGLDGKAQADAVVHAATDHFQAATRGYIPPVGADVDGHFELKEVPSGRRISLFAITKDRRLAGTAQCDAPVESGKAPFIQIKLQDTKIASVIIKDTFGSALENKTLQINPVVSGHRMPRAQRSAKTDEQGLLEIDGILHGLEYYLQEIRGSSANMSRLGPGERTPLRGTLVLISDESNSSQEQISKVSESGKKNTNVVLDQAYAQFEKLATSLLSHPLPGFQEIDIEFTAEQAKGKRILACLWDMEQRPSRNCVVQMARRATELKRKDIAVLGIHISAIEKNELDAWMKSNRIFFPIGIVQTDTEKPRLKWGVRSLPWLILTDQDHIVRAEGFALTELDENLKKNK